MASKSSESSSPTAGQPGPEQFLNLQKELLEAYEEASRSWLARVKSEVDLWSKLAQSLTESRSAPEVLQVYQQCVAQRMQMAAEDGRRLSEECQKIMSKVARSSWPGSSGST